MRVYDAPHPCYRNPNISYPILKQDNRTLSAQWKFSGDKHKSLQVDTERTFHQRYPLAML